MAEDSPQRPFLVFDGKCSFCGVWIEYWKRLTGDQVQYAPYQEVAGQFPDIPQKDFAAAVKLILPDGEVHSGAHAVFSTLALLPGKRWMSWCYEYIPPFAILSEAAYGLIARHRSLGYWVTRLLWGVPVQPEEYSVCTWLFLRLLGAIYLMAFASFGVQAAGLIGSRGILPADGFLRAVRQYYGSAGFWHVPTLLWWGSGDSLIKGTWIAGICLALLLLFGVNLRVVRVALFLLYLSLSTAGQEFMSYQWDALLLETGFLAIFLGSSSLIVWLGRWLLFRLMFLSGAVKLLSGDPSWHSFTALPVHYQTQPLPTPLAWYVFQLPTWFHHLSVGVMFFVELAVPFLIFAPRRGRLFAAVAITGFQLLIFLTGNYAFFNLLAILLCLLLLDDARLGRIFPKKAASRITAANRKSRWPRMRRMACGVFAALVLIVSGFQLVETFTRLRWMPADVVIQTISPFEIINTYGLFAVMTTARPEIVIEGSNDGQTWLPYEFKYKAGDLKRRPIWVEPHQPRLDWQMWFAALGDYQSDPWIIHFMARLLEGSPDVLRLLDRNPFPGGPPRYGRALVYEYRFTTSAEKAAAGEYWHRDLKGSYVPVLSLRNQ
jgi:predicted DCC family thiol-disulfide oxidoreductase YuxK